MKPAKTYFKFFMNLLYPSYMKKVFTCFLFFLSFWAVSQKNSFEVQYEDKDFIYLDDAYVNLLKDTHAQLILRHKDCLYIETCKNIKTKNLGEVLYQKKANNLYIPTYKEQPKYPSKARLENIEGYVILKFDIELDGSTSNHQVIEGKCIEGQKYPYENCTEFNTASLRAARQNKYDLNVSEKITDVPHKYTYKLDGMDSSKVFVDIQSRKLERSVKFINSKQWEKLQKLAESIDDNYIKFYWLGLAFEYQNNRDLALQNYIKSYEIGGDPKVHQEVRNRILSLIYRFNLYKTYEFICDETHTFYDNYMCGMNMLQIGDSIGGVPFLVKAYRKNLEDNDSNQRIAEIIESQRNWIKEDLIKLQSSS